jgi:hypothetical protein
VAFGLSSSASELQQRLAGAESAAFLIARDGAAGPGFTADSDGSMAVRRKVGRFGVTFAGESGQVRNALRPNADSSPYRWASLALDRKLGGTWLSAGISRLQETQTVLGGRMDALLGGGGATSMFLDVQARRQLGSGLSAGVTARRGWTDFASGKFGTAAYSLDVTKTGVLGAGDRIGLRFAQPLRVESGGFAMLLPTSYDYLTATATNSLQRYSMRPSGREVDAELSYSASVLGDMGWLSANLFARKDPGHIAGAAPDVGSAVRFSLSF